jgi:2-oxoglutarate dehydrogenase E1 component
MINAHRFLGVRIANLDPLARHAKPEVPELTLAHYSFTEGTCGYHLGNRFAGTHSA